MTDDIQAQIHMAAAGPSVVIEARVGAERVRPLSWRLTVRTLGPSGSISNIAQSGRTDGTDLRPVAVVTVNHPGDARLQVFEGDHEVANLDEAVPATSQIP
jgi:hypothetical protein